MKKYLISVEGNFGYPGGDFDAHDVITEDYLNKAVREALMPYLENWIKDDENEQDLIAKTIEESGFSFCNLGYGEELYITIKDV